MMVGAHRFTYASLLVFQYSLKTGKNKFALYASYMAMIFAATSSKVLSLSQISKHAPAWFIPSWIACEIVFMNVSLAKLMHVPRDRQN